MITLSADLQYLGPGSDPSAKSRFAGYLAHIEYEGLEVVRCVCGRRLIESPRLLAVAGTPVAPMTRGTATRGTGDDAHDATTAAG